MNRYLLTFIFIILYFLTTTNSVSSFEYSNHNERFAQIDEDLQSNKDWYSLTSDFKVVPGKNVQSALAWGYFKDELFQDGWGKLSIETQSSIDNEQTAFKAAGYLEGYLTWRYIYNFSINYFESNFNTSNVKEFPLGVMSFITDNINWMQSQIDSLSSTDPYWFQVNNAFEQMNGVYEGYNAAISDSSFELSFFEIYLLNLYGDIGDIITATSSDNHEFNPMSRSDVEEYMATSGHCTGLIKLTANNSELYVAHTTWSDYSDMIRIYKKIKIPVASTPNGYETLFASYPGLLVSIDDFYMIKPSKLMLTETLNSILNQTLYNLITPQSLLYWARNLVANRLSDNGFEWVYNYVQYNSGTNNIQFMVIDYKLFKPNEPIQSPGLLWIVEQYVGGYEAADVTFTLIEHGYWPSYNRPYFLKVYDVLGYPYYLENYGSLFSYEYNPRANIFRRQQPFVETIEDVQSLILYNQYKTDPFSGGYPGNAIAARYDIAATPMPPYSWFYHGTHGAIDGKVMNSAMFETFTVFAINGPAVSSDCPPFSWSDWSDVSHVGMPDVFNFSWINISL